MKDLEQYGITTLADITDRGKIKRLVKMLRATFSDLLFYDYTIPETDLPPAERTILTQGQIPAYWNELKKTTPENYYKKRNRFRDLVNRYGKQNIQETIRNLITQKWDDLLKTGPKTLQKLTGDAKGDITEINRSSIGLKPVNLHNPNNTPPGDPPGRFCLGCGKDISHQRQGTKFCTEKFVGEKQAHKCRNIDSNRRNNDKNRIKLKKKKGISFLFDPETLLNMKKKTG
ncbi:MAG: hypothetical protein NTW10_01275 [Bacteroidetes bacterium]|nr:hypothetical protein [Bacteroidota bacterium]